MIGLILQMREMKPREAESLAQGHTVLSGRTGIHTLAGTDLRRKGSLTRHQKR